MGKKIMKKTVKVTKADRANEIVVTIRLETTSDLTAKGGSLSDKPNAPLKNTRPSTLLYWTTSDGRTLSLSEMSKPHLVNAIKWCLHKSQILVKDGYMIRDWCDMLVDELGGR